MHDAELTATYRCRREDKTSSSDVGDLLFIHYGIINYTKLLITHYNLLCHNLC